MKAQCIMYTFRPLALIILRIAAKFCRCSLNSAVNTRVTAYIIARACIHDFSKYASDDITIFRYTARLERIEIGTISPVERS